MKIRLTVTVVFGVVFGFLLGTALCVYAATALETVKAPIDQIVTILQDPQYQDGAKQDEQDAQPRGNPGPTFSNAPGTL